MAHLGRKSNFLQPKSIETHLLELEMRLALPQRHPRNIDLVLRVDFLAALVRLERVLVLAWPKN